MSKSIDLSTFTWLAYPNNGGNHVLNSQDPKGSYKQKQLFGLWSKLGEK